MADFVKLEDWGLQAIVRGSSRSELWTTNIDPNSCFMEMPKDYYDGHHHHPSLYFNFSGLLDTASSILTDELQELYKPFCSVSYDSSPPSQTVSPVSGLTCTDISSSFSVKMEVKEDSEPNHHQPYQEVCQKVSARVDTSSTVTATAYVPKYKKRKNQHKRVVMQVTAEELTSDKWAWRKYGQKPIKGSPYPRSYYRCSSSKGCLARKQVEQSCTDPGIYILTYTAEHCHSQPTRRNALAGTIRQKFGSTPKSPLCSTKPNSAPKSENSGICTTTSPTQNPLVAEEESVIKLIKKEESNHHHPMEMVDDLMISRPPEVMFDDDFFSCLNDLDGIVSELRDGNSSSDGNVSFRAHYL